MTNSVEGGGSLDVGEPKDPVFQLGSPWDLTGLPYLVKVDRYGSVSGLSRVEVPLGMLVIVPRDEAGSSRGSL